MQCFSSDLTSVSMRRPLYSLHSSDDRELFHFTLSYVNLLTFVTALCLLKLFLLDFYISTCLESVESIERCSLLAGRICTIIYSINNWWLTIGRKAVIAQILQVTGILPLTNILAWVFAENGGWDKSSQAIILLKNINSNKGSRSERKE